MFINNSASNLIVQQIKNCICSLIEKNVIFMPSNTGKDH